MKTVTIFYNAILFLVLLSATATAKEFLPENPEEGMQFLPLKVEDFGQFNIDPSYARDLQIYYRRRQYPGSPPFIPHPLDGLEFEKNGTCASCHNKGGFVKKWNAYAPVTPHPERVSCRQCHVPQLVRKQFRKHNWQAMNTYPIKRAAISGGPPGIPHQLFGRGSCLSCHGGPSAIREIKTSHPERIYCRQCHVSLLGQ